MNSGVTVFLLVAGLLLGGCSGRPDTEEMVVEAPEPVMASKTNSMKLYMHYMPWFHSKDFSGYWGSHWRMANKNPDVIGEDGKREIASHYYPLIGPYDSQDPDVIEYHLLLMKYAGIDGVLIDWYGSHKLLDYYTNLENANALISRLDTIGLEFGIVYEEYTTENVAQRKGIPAIEAAQADLEYLESNYFQKERYIEVGDKPLLLTFGPRYFREEYQWDQIFQQLAEPPHFFPLWHHSGRVGSNGSGEFSWVDFNLSLAELETFYSNASSPASIIGSAYPGFDDFYEEGGWGESYGHVMYLDGQTLSSTLAKAQEHNLQHLQLVTWNDFGEGTMIEPTDEFGFRFLEIIQEFAGVAYGTAELELVYQYYLKKKEHKGKAAQEAVLARVFDRLNALEVDEARALLNEL